MQYVSAFVDWLAVFTVDHEYNAVAKIFNMTKGEQLYQMVTSHGLLELRQVAGKFQLLDLDEGVHEDDTVRKVSNLGRMRRKLHASNNGKV
jgi:hypothetical protein